MKNLIKPAVMGLMILVLMIPLAIIEDSVRERSDNRDTVNQDIANSWTGPQTLGDPSDLTSPSQ